MPLPAQPRTPIRLITSGSTDLVNGTSNGSLPLVSGGDLIPATTSLNADSNWRSKGDFTNLYCRVTANTWNTASTVNLRINDTTVRNTFSIPGTTTGEFTDVINIDPINFAVAVQSMNAFVTIGGTAGQTCTIAAMAVNFTPTAANLDSQRLGVASTGASFTGSTSPFFVPLCGSPGTTIQQVESAVQTTFDFATTIRRLYLRVSANSVAATSTLNTRINGINGSVTVSVGSNATGNFEDTTNTDAVNLNDLVNFAMVLGSATGTLTFVGIGLDSLASLNGYSQNLAIATVGSTVANNTTVYLFSQGTVESSAVEANVQVQAGVAYTASMMAAVVTANDTSTSTFRFRINGVSGNQSVSIGSSATGYFVDAVNTDSIEPSYEINYALTTGASGSSIRFTYLSHLSKFKFPSKFQIPQALRPRVSAPGLAR